MRTKKIRTIDDIPTRSSTVDLLAGYYALTIPNGAIDPKKAVLTKIHPDTLDIIYPTQDGIHYWAEENTAGSEKILKYCRKGKMLHHFYMQKSADIMAVHAHALAIKKEGTMHIFHNHPSIIGDHVKDTYDKSGNTVLRKATIS